MPQEGPFEGFDQKEFMDELENELWNIFEEGGSLEEEETRGIYDQWVEAYEIWRQQNKTTSVDDIEFTIKRAELCFDGKDLDSAKEHLLYAEMAYENEIWHNKKFIDIDEKKFFGERIAQLRQDLGLVPGDSLDPDPNWDPTKPTEWNPNDVKEWKPGDDEKDDEDDNLV